MRFYLDRTDKRQLCQELGLSPKHFDRVLMRTTGYLWRRAVSPGFFAAISRRFGNTIPARSGGFFAKPVKPHYFRLCRGYYHTIAHQRPPRCPRSRTPTRRSWRLNARGSSRRRGSPSAMSRTSRSPARSSPAQSTAARSSSRATPTAHYVHSTTCAVIARGRSRSERAGANR